MIRSLGRGNTLNSNRASNSLRGAVGGDSLYNRWIRTRTMEHREEQSVLHSHPLSGLDHGQAKPWLSLSQGCEPVDPDLVDSMPQASEVTSTAYVPPLPSPPVSPVSTESPSSSPSDSTTSWQRKLRLDRRRRRIPPLSLADYVISKGHFSVSELVAPTWCEYSYQYGILGLSFLPAARRPKEVKLPSGAVLIPDIRLAEKKEELQEAGKEIHKELEVEIHPERFFVKTQSKEDDWALKLLRLVVGLRALIDHGCVRELPVFGWVQDHLVVGIIDEVQRRPLPAKTEHHWPLATLVEKHPSNQLKLSFPTLNVQNDHPSISAAPPHISSETPPSNGSETLWSSQTEWKVHKRKAAAAKKAAAKGKRKGRRRGEGEGEANGRATGVKDSRPSTDPDPVRYGYFLSDTKTRSIPTIPPIPNQRKARLQTMMYKRLLDGLCLGAVSRAEERHKEHKTKVAKGKAVQVEEQERDQEVKRSKKAGLMLDFDATPVDMARLFAQLSLQPQKELSEAFLRDAQGLLEGVDLSLGKDHKAGKVKDSIDASLPGIHTLSDVADLLDTSLLEFIDSARKQAGLIVEDERGTSKRSRAAAGAIQSSLSLVYRLQNTKDGRFKRHKRKRSTSRDQALEDTASSPSVERTDVVEQTQHSRGEISRQARVLPLPIPAASDMKIDEDGEEELALTFQLQAEADLETAIVARSSTEQHVNPNALASSSNFRKGRDSGFSTKRRRSRRLALARGEIEEGETVETNARSQNSTVPNSSSSDPNTSTSSSTSTSTVIGTATYPHTSRLLTLHLTSILDFWFQLRPPRGVNERDTWKCNVCEWREGCEWRAEKGEERSRRVWKHMPPLHDRDGGGGSGGERKKVREIKGHEVQNEKVILNQAGIDQIEKEEEFEVKGEEEEELWAYFDSPPPPPPFEIEGTKEEEEEDGGGGLPLEIDIEEAHTLLR